MSGSMNAADRFRYVMAGAVGAGLAAAAALGVSCNPLPHDGIEVTRGECVTCHRSEYETAVEPLHLGVLPETCSDCHAEDHWSPASGFDHDARFELRGAHANVACNACHTKGYEPGDTPSTCVSCHRDDYDQAKDPLHTDYDTQCQSCHDEAAWRPAPNFDHEWPLTGAHKQTLCAGCHMGDPPVYEGTSQACVSCHREDYDSSPFPGHSAFATTCQDCHSTSGWTPATGGHPESRFPIKREPHSKVSCAGCHNADLGPNGKNNADCVGCHTGEHSRSKMDEKHHEVSGYTPTTTQPSFCLKCHADGRKHED
jgi:Cytochrome c7 and related cytochrome c